VFKPVISKLEMPDAFPVVSIPMDKVDFEILLSMR